MRQVSRLWLLVVLVALLSGCGYNAIQQKDEAVKASWSEVLNQYKRRADLVPNLVNTVQGFATQERQVLTEVTEARSRVGQINVNADDEASLRQFQQVALVQRLEEVGHARVHAPADVVMRLRDPSCIPSVTKGVDVKLASVSAIAPDCLLDRVAGHLWSPT